MTHGALVLSGGGVAGIAWELGVLRGLESVRPDIVEHLIEESTVFVGTSAGSAVAAQLASGVSLDELCARQEQPETGEIRVDVDLGEFMVMMAAAMTGVATPEEGRRRLGEIALAADTISEADRRAVIEWRLPSHDWPSRRMLLPAVDTLTGELRVFDRDSGVALVDAVAASCAVPGVWPPVTIGERRYMDGGTRTTSNADLAAGAEWMVLLAPGAEFTPQGAPIVPTAELAALHPIRSELIYADDASLAAFGDNPLDPDSRFASLAAGKAVGVREAARVGALFD